MTLTKRLLVGGAILACATAMAASAAAAAPQALSPDDVQHYVAAFGDVDRGDFIDAQVQTAAVRDKSLLGYLSFSQLMHPSAHKAAFEELAAWLGKFRDLPVADRIFALAAKRKPPQAADPPQPTLLLGPDPTRAGHGAPTDEAQKARDAFYAGDVARALQIATEAHERWIAGLASYRLGDYRRAEREFTALAGDGDQDPWSRAAGGFWAARSADVLADVEREKVFLRAAAQLPDTFYGMLAARRLELLRAQGETPSIDSLIQAAYVQPAPELVAFIAGDDRAHRAAALAQIGRLQEAAQEIRAGLVLARNDAERRRWTGLAGVLGVALAAPGGGISTGRTRPIDYPLPPLEPKSGFTVDKALVYAIVRQESGFNPGALSPKGAVGLMQLMPEAAVRAAGDDKLRADMSPLFDPGFNLRVGQDYLTWLQQKGVGYDLVKTVAAYNGGPGQVAKTAQQVGPGADDLLLMECLPAAETRAYVQRVMAGYWTYRQLFGEDTRSLDALAAGAREVDARLDLADAQGGEAQPAAQPMQVGLR